MLKFDNASVRRGLENYGDCDGQIVGRDLYSENIAAKLQKEIAWTGDPIPDKEEGTISLLPGIGEINVISLFSD